MEQVIVAKNLRKVYDNKVEAVKDLNIEVHSGEVLGFLGPNGAGKSTSINMFTGILRPTSGTLEVLGINLPENNKKLSDQIGYVPQNLVFYEHLTVEENLKLFAIAYGISNKQDKIEELLELLQIQDLCSRRADSMSGGQKRRLNLAIGLLHAPEILFLDEPSAGMDPQSRNVLWNMVEKLAKENNITIILTTHLMETADRLADRVAIIDHGVVQVVDTPENLKKRFGNGDTVKLSIHEDTDDDEITSLMDKLIEIFGSEHVRRNDHKISINTMDGANAVATVIEVVEISIGKSQLVQIAMHENTLEDVFIAITGRELRE